MQTVDIPVIRMLFVYGACIFPVLGFVVVGCKLSRPLLIAVIRMSVQLSLIGFYLRFLFELNNGLLNIGWVVLMMGVANYHTLKGARLDRGRFFLSSFLSIFVGTAVAAFIFIGLSIQPQPLYDARYIVPICGMILGNCLRVNILSLDRFFSQVTTQSKLWQTYISLGASRFEAARPFMRTALSAAVTPTITTMTTMGLVSLPGMMTGQMLGGGFPLVAIKYQIAIMLSIFTASSLTSIFNLLFSVLIGFDRFSNVKPGVYNG